MPAWQNSGEKTSPVGANPAQRCISSQSKRNARLIFNPICRKIVAEPPFLGSYLLRSQKHGFPEVPLFLAVVAPLAGGIETLVIERLQDGLQYGFYKTPRKSCAPLKEGFDGNSGTATLPEQWQLQAIILTVTD